VDERSILPIGPGNIDYEIDGVDRSGWLYQQLLKLAAASVVAQRYSLALDADTIFL
jgi:hypothetical protein